MHDTLVVEHRDDGAKVDNDRKDLSIKDNKNLKPINDASITC